MADQALPDCDQVTPLEPHPLVIDRKRRAPDRAAPLITFVGFPDEAADNGETQRLYLNLQLDCYVEFNVADICTSELIRPSDSAFKKHFPVDSPFRKYPVTRVFLKENSSIRAILTLNSSSAETFNPGLPLGWPGSGQFIVECVYCFDGDPRCP
jgi:hypothetical protein